jgi:hypothetical protein
MSDSAPDPTLFTIGDIGVGRVWIVTPRGHGPMNGSQWFVQDRTTVEEKIPQWAIICAIVGFFFVCAFSLLFLLAKEKTVTGYVEVTVTSEGLQHVANVGAADTTQLAQVHNLVAQAQQMALSAPPVS